MPQGIERTLGIPKILQLDTSKNNMRSHSALLLCCTTAVLSFLTACTADEIDGPVPYPERGYHDRPRFDRPHPRDRPYHKGADFCSADYAPVCAARDGYRKTFSNACHAEAADYRLLFAASC